MTHRQKDFSKLERGESVGYWWCVDSDHKNMSPCTIPNICSPVTSDLLGGIY